MAKLKSEVFVMTPQNLDVIRRLVDAFSFKVAANRVTEFRGFCKFNWE